MGSPGAVDEREMERIDRMLEEHKENCLLRTPKTMKRVYLASPYWHENPQVREMRYVSVTRATARLISMETCIFSPITHSHPVSQTMPQQTHEFWLAQDREFVDWANELWVFMLPGWKESFGVYNEWFYAKFYRGIPIRFIDPVSLQITQTGG